MVGAVVGMGITWEVVVAAEMISGGGSNGGGAGGGMGFFIWNSYVGGSYEQIVVGMISIGIAGFCLQRAAAASGPARDAMVEPALTRQEPAGVPAFSSAGEIVVSGVSRSYGTGPDRKEVVRDCSFTIERGKLSVIIGPSGCGKSTLIRLLAGFGTPHGGHADARRGTHHRTGAGIGRSSSRSRRCFPG